MMKNYPIRDEGATQERQMNFSSRFKFGDSVAIDGGSVVGCVVGFSFYSHDNQVQVSWWNNGTLLEQWVSEWRLTLHSGYSI